MIENACIALEIIQEILCVPQALPFDGSPFIR